MDISQFHKKNKAIKCLLLSDHKRMLYLICIFSNLKGNAVFHGLSPADNVGLYVYERAINLLRFDYGLLELFKRRFGVLLILYDSIEADRVPQ